jgi:hypothetical protein
MPPGAIVVARLAWTKPSCADGRLRVPSPTHSSPSARIAQLAAEGGHDEREAAAWELAERIARLGSGHSFNPYRHKRLRYPVIEAS